ncbi:tripartite tricarboxylate transporter TctB family protein [Piscinibacterium candidicorallinum]|uniref:Tripartite tricarboxylate transporter TctB family protein n=1 Tax=Piscinibacterium candidicorallinum TaxID=1793872 RepID=A0ABV7H231_9BURK
MFKIRSYPDFWSGMMFITVGLFFSIYGRINYDLGTAGRMGPGYFPFWLGLILAGLGLIVLFGALSAKRQEEEVGAWDWKSIVFVLGATVIFGFMLRPVGMILAVTVLVAVASLASHESRFGAVIKGGVAGVVAFELCFLLGRTLTSALRPVVESVSESLVGASKSLGGLATLMGWVDEIILGSVVLATVALGVWVLLKIAPEKLLDRLGKEYAVATHVLLSLSVWVFTIALKLTIPVRPDWLS